MSRLAADFLTGPVMVLGVAGVCIGLGGCFQPAFQDGQFQCGPEAQCPPGFRCDPGRGVCVDESAQVADAAPFDGDTAVPDADPFAGRVAGAVLLYIFDEGQGEIIYDRSGLEPALDLTIMYPEQVEWGAGTLAIADENRIWRSTPPERLIRAVQASNEFTVEAWIDPAETAIDGPRRIFTLSQSGGFQSLVLGQGGDIPGDEVDTYVLRTRTSDYDGDYDLSPVKTGPGTAVLGRTHLVFARDSVGLVRMYINGEQVAQDYHTGNFSVWGVDSRHLLGVGNEHDGARQWPGILHLIAFYDRALDESEAATNYAVGPDPELRQ